MNPFERPLFIFEMANNHMGSVRHGLRLIQAFAQIAARYPFRFAFKFQFRHLETFFHPDYRDRLDIPYVKRFRETRLSREEFQQLKECAEDHMFMTICTPFDEPSVDLIEEMDFDVIKIASCSFTDWPLLERIVVAAKPIIASTAGASVDDMDKVVSFFQHRQKIFALMHCVGEYPTGADHLQLNQIDLLRHRYPDLPIGYSTHEEPDNVEAIQIAIAKGATLFEKHVALEAEGFPKNAYSATPLQADRWLASAQRAFAMCGVAGRRSDPSAKELADLRQFKRGVFAARKIAQGERIHAGNVFLAFPNTDQQLVANDLSKYTVFIARRDLEEKAPIKHTDVYREDKREKIYSIVQQVKQMLAQANVVVPGMAQLEISHHYGLDKFDHIGSTIINVINREYCKKYIVLFPGQSHPEQYHKIKEETFVVLHGDVTLSLDGRKKKCSRGDIVTITRGTRHDFHSEAGAIIEEISSAHFAEDSYYTDETINANPERKTLLTHWMS
ncbi:MAG: N-acetylneuraminate synthase family protein [Desulfosoma sp.]